MKELSELNAIYQKMSTPDVDEAMIVTNADKKGNTPAYQGYKAGKKNVKTGKPMYKAADHMKEEEEVVTERTLSSYIPSDRQGEASAANREYVKSQLSGNIRSIDEISDYFTNVIGRKFEPTDAFTGKVKTVAEGIEEMAAYMIRETYPTYSRVPPVIQALRKFHIR